MFAEYIPYFLAAIRTKMDMWSDVAKSGETIEMVEQTWTLAADMICKALFDRDMPFNPRFVFKSVKAYTDVIEATRRSASGGRGGQEVVGGPRRMPPRRWRCGRACRPPCSAPSRARSASTRS